MTEDANATLQAADAATEETFSDVLVGAAPEPCVIEKRTTKVGSSWIEVRLRGEDGEPIAGERYTVELPDGRVFEGRLGAEGTVMVEGFDPGTCSFSFPDLDEAAWKQMGPD